MKKCCIIVPLWKYDLYDYELLSLKRILNIYNNSNYNIKYDMWFLIPDEFDINTLLNKYNLSVINYRWAQYEQYFFNSSITYNKLLYQENFYKMFEKNYKYMLIYQLDSYIFNEQLLDYFIEKDYDYIGSYENTIDEYILDYISSITNNYDFKLNTNHYIKMNGGISLRKISFCIDLLSNSKDFALTIYSSDEHLLEEDYYLSVYLTKEVPAIDSIKFGYSHVCFKTALCVNNYEYPFGCHSISHDRRLMKYIYEFNEKYNIV